LLLAASTWRGAILEHARLFHPAVEGRGHFRHEYLPALFETIQKGRVAAIPFVKGPGLDAYTVSQDAVDQRQADLRLGPKFDLVGNVVFWRRAASAAHSWVR